MAASKVRAGKSADFVAKWASNTSKSDSSKERAAKSFENPQCMLGYSWDVIHHGVTATASVPTLKQSIISNHQLAFKSYFYILLIPQGKMESVLSGQKTARKTAAKVSEYAPGATGDCADDASYPRDSQRPLQAIPEKRKLCLDKKDKTTPANESTEKPSGKMAKVQTEPEAKPTPPAQITPAALLDSEEETILALLEGRSPKKSKLKKNSSTKIRDVAAATVTVQDSSVLEKSLPRHVTLLPKSQNSEDEDFVIKCPAVPKLSQLSAKKRGKNHKSPSKIRLSKKKHKKNKKAKKEKKVMAEETTSSKPTKKKKSDKDKKKGGDKAKKECKKLMQGSAASFGESTDSGVGLQSKLKKKASIGYIGEYCR
ncbi:nucleolar protein 58-like [Ranitomeya imitator]|uniref:nucleolar protein 58-like n=1 Tax=Ranitomeya imitator TaxID=111125 RepID=UPI0037E94244